MGRPPKPIGIHEVRGTYRADRHDRNQPRPKVRQPRVPEHLTGEARTCWLKLAPMLMELRVLTEADALALERVCMTYGEIRRYETVLAEQGDTYQPEALDRQGNRIQGMIRPRPEVAMLAVAARLFRQMLADFGLNPSARARIEAAPEEAAPDDPTAEFMN